MVDRVDVTLRRLRTPPKRVFFLAVFQRCRCAVLVEDGDDVAVVGDNAAVALVDGRGTSLIWV